MSCRMYLVAGVLWLASSVLSQGPLPPVYRLPTSVTPLNYVIHLEPHLEDNTISGVVMIELNITNNQNEDLNSITMHMGLDVKVNENKVKLLEYTGVIKKVAAFKYDDDNTLIEVVFNDTLQNNHVYMITLPFTSILYSEPKGLFTGFFDETTNSRYIASHFRATHARDMFPCFDEPGYKVPITLQVLHPKSYSVISTAPLNSSSKPDANNMVLDIFSATDPIPIHSLGLFMSEVASVSTMGVQLYALPGTNTTVPYLETLLENIIKRFGNFPSSSLALVVLPDRLYSSFDSYGIVFTSPEVYLDTVPCPLKKPFLTVELTQAFLRQYLEYAQTPVWWSDLWLSESIGVYFATMLLPQYQAWLKTWLKVVDRSTVLGVDYITPSGPVVNNQPMSRWDIENIISNHTIAEKGLTVLNMWNDTMPEGLVDKTINDFINLKKSSVNTTDLYEIMKNNILANTTYNVSSAIDLLPVWLNTSGNPILKYTPGSSSSLVLVLEEAPGCSSFETSGNPVWPISISFTQNSTRNWEEFRWGLWMLNSTETITTNETLESWLVLNLESAPYRVNYTQPDKIVKALQTDLTPSTSPVTIRAMLQDDAVALALQGCLTFDVALNVLSSTQRNFLDWYPVAKTFDILTSLIGPDQYAYDRFTLFVNSLFPPTLLSYLDLMNSLNTTQDLYVRALLTPWICHFDLGNCRDTVADLVPQILTGNKTLELAPSDVENVMCLGSRYSSNQSALFTDLVLAYANTSSLEWRDLYSTAISCLTDNNTVVDILNTIVNTTNPFTATNAGQIMVGLASSIENSDTMVNFIAEQAPRLQIQPGTAVLSATIKVLSKFRVDLSKLDSLNNPEWGLDAYVIQSAVQAVAKSISSQQWWTAYGSDLVASLPQGNYTTTVSPTSPTTITSGTTNVTSTSISPTTPSSAISMMDFQIVSLILVATLTVLPFIL